MTGSRWTGYDRHQKAFILGNFCCCAVFFTTLNSHSRSGSPILAMDECPPVRISKSLIFTYPTRCTFECSEVLGTLIHRFYLALRELRPWFRPALLSSDYWHNDCDIDLKILSHLSILHRIRTTICTLKCSTGSATLSLNLELSIRDVKIFIRSR